MIDGFVNSIFLYDNHFVITLNYKNNSRTVTFDEINSSPLTSKGLPDGIAVYKFLFIDRYFCARLRKIYRSTLHVA